MSKGSEWNRNALLGLAMASGQMLGATNREHERVMAVLAYAIPLVHDAGHEEERERIATWLRNVVSNGTHVDPAVSARIFADMIEKGPSS